MLFLQVIEGLETISWSAFLARVSLAWRQSVSDRLSCCSPIWSGLYLGAISCILERASIAHVWGLVQPSALSWLQFRHAQVWVGVCLPSGCWSCSFFAALTRSATVVALWHRRRQQAGPLVIGQGLEKGWYHAGSFILMLGERHIAARLVPYFFATLSILMLQSPIMCVCGPFVGGVQDCVNMFTLAITEVPGGAAAFMMRSVTIAQARWDGVRSRYDFSHINSMASLRALISNMFRPPSSIGFPRCSRDILGEVSFSQMKSLVIWVIAASMCSGIPWDIARNWVSPPIMA